MQYRNKKDLSIIAEFDSENEKTKTTTLVYVTGDKPGYSFTITNSTLRRYWEPIEEEKPRFTDEELKQINEPYKPDVTPHYIPKPQSVIEYEEKRKMFTHNADLPEFDEIVELFGPKLVRVNERSSYVSFSDKTTLHRKSKSVRLYTVEKVWEALTLKGLHSEPNKDKDRPFAFIINTREEFDVMREVLINTL